jgi:HSP90 family molecular chaperone
VVKLQQLRQSDATLSELVAHQLFDQARLAAGRLEDPRSMLSRMNTLLSRVVGA